MDSLPTPCRVTLAAPPSIGGEPLDPITLSVYAAGPEASPAVVLCHGFPDLACSWRRQIEALSQAGFRVLAPDQRGYGASDCPAATEAYDLEHLTGDLVGLLDAHDIERAVFAGHDWGGFVVWAMAVLHPERTAGVIGVNTPYLAFPKMELLRQLVPDEDKLYVSVSASSIANCSSNALSASPFSKFPTNCFHPICMWVSHLIASSSTSNCFS